MTTCDSSWIRRQDYAINPLLMARGIHPALVIAGVLAGGEIAGGAGMFLSVPVIAAFRIVSRRLQAPENAPADDEELEGSVGDVKTSGLPP